MNLFDESPVLKEIKHYVVNSSQALHPLSPKADPAFLHKQNQFLAQKNKKINYLKNQQEEQLNRQLTLRPKINKQSHRYSREEVYKRLTNVPKKIVLQESSSGSFVPTILSKSKKLQRQSSAVKLLYEDAVRRQEKVKSLSQSRGCPKRRSMSKENQLYLSKRCLRQFYEKVYKLELNQSINVQDCLKILEQLGYLPKTLNQELCLLVQRMFRMISLEPVMELDSLRNFVLALQSSAQEIHTDQLGLGHFEDSTWVCSQADFGKIKYIFKPMLNSKMGRQFKSQKTQRSSFAPEILKKSRQMAQKRVSKFYSTAKKLGFNIDNVELSHVDLLILQKKVKEIQIQQQRIAKQEDTKRHCTFQPNVLKTRNEPNWQLLAANVLKPPKIQQDSFDSECKFTPQVHEAPKATAPVYGEMELRHIQRNLTARIQRQKAQQRKNLREYRATERKQPVIQVLIRVNEQQEQSLLVFEGEQIEKAVHQFAVQHGLSEGKEQKLIQRLKARLRESE